MNHALSALRRIVDERRDLPENIAFEVFCEILDGDTTIAQSAAIAVALRLKPEGAGELAGAVRAMRQKATQLHPKADNFVDIVGPGSGTKGAFGVQAVAAIVASAAGVKAASHGSADDWSGHGSASVLRALGLNPQVPHPTVERSIDEAGLGFLFMDHINRGLAHLAPIRNDLGVRTIYNLLGPLSNPVNAPAGLIGLPMPHGLKLAPDVLRATGLKRAYIVAGEGGLDHVAVTGATNVLWLDNEKGQRRDFVVNPEDFGIERATPAQVAGGANPNEEAEMINGLLTDRGGARRDLVVLNAAFAIAAAERGDPAKAVKRAQDAIDSGAAMRKLDQVRKLYGGPVG